MAESAYAALEQRLGHVFADVSLLESALTHKSFLNENPQVRRSHGERLEFLGDAVFDLVVGHLVMERFPHGSEGELSIARAAIVNEAGLAQLGLELGLGEWLFLGKGEENSGGADKSSILADGVESLLGAIYLQHGLTTSREVILRLFGELLDTAPTLGAGLDWKSSLQELTASRGLGAPTYVVTSTGPDHDKEFSASVVVADVEYGRGVGRNKKEAELKAAAAAWNALDNA